MNARDIMATVKVRATTKVECRHPPAGSALLNETDWAEIARVLRLSGRELQIVRGVFNNRTEHAIAADQSIADGTVHTHLERLYRKLAVTTRVELVLRVIETWLQPKPPPPYSNGAFRSNKRLPHPPPAAGGVL